MADPLLTRRDVERDDRFYDRYGEARVMGVIDGYAMMRRKKDGNPFIVSLKKLTDGLVWERVDDR